LLPAAALAGRRYGIVVPVLGVPAVFVLARWLPAVEPRIGAGVAATGALLAHLLGLMAGADAASPAPVLPPRGIGAVPDAGRPSILLISVDTLRDDRVGAVRDGKPVSPFLDRLGAEGIRATTISSGNQTGPAHASLLTGAHVLRNGVYGNSVTMPDSVPTLAELMFEADYRTAGVVSNPVISSDAGYARGFECYGDVTRARAPQAQAFFGLNRASSRWRWLARRHGLAQLWIEHLEWRTRLTPKSLQPTADQTRRRAESVLESLGADPRPYFLFVHFMDPHHPYDPPAATRGTWTTERELAGIPTGSTEAFHAFRDGLLARARRDDLRATAQGEAIARLYDEEILFLDGQIEGLVTAARRAAGDRPLWILLTADHGEHLLEHDLLGHANSLYEELVRLPLIVHGVPAGSPEELPLRLEDVPRFLASRALGEPASRLLADGSPELAPGLSVQIWGRRASLRTGRWKLLAESERFLGEYRPLALWDLAAPGGEASDVSSANPDLLADLLASLNAAVAGSAPAPRSERDAGANERVQRALAQLGYAGEDGG
jgi:arylsulfatase A-like enzyme